MTKEKITLEKLAAKMDKRFDKVDERLAAHDRRFDLIDKKFDEHDKRFDEHDKRFDEHDKRFDEHDKRFDIIDIRIDKLVRAVFDLSDETRNIKENMATKDDINRITNILDQQTKILKDLDRERIFGTQWLKRLDKDVEELKSK